MNKQRKTSHILNIFQYDDDGHVVIPASLTLGIAPGNEDNSAKVPSTAWVRTYVASIGGVLGTGTTNYVSKFTASGSIGNSLIFDNGTTVLIGTTTAPTPVMGVSFPFSVTSSAATRIRIDSTQATPNSGVGLYANGVQKFSFAMFGATSDFTIYNDALLAASILVKGNTNNILIGTSTDNSSKLRVNGTGWFDNSLTATSFVKNGGAATEILAADGSVITAGTGITISGGTISSTVTGGVTSFNTRTGAITLSSNDVTTALGFTPISSYTETDTLATVTSRGSSTTGAITISSGGDLNLRAISGSSDSGDIVFQDGSGAELHRLWGGSSTINYRTNAGTTYQLWHTGNLTNLNQLTNGPGYITGYTETDTLASVTGRGDTTSSQIISTSSAGSGSIISRNDGSGTSWRGRIGHWNATADRSVWLATYNGFAVVGAHNNALNAWADLLVNCVDNSGSGGTVRLASSAFVGSNAILHAGNYNSYSPTLTGGGASGTWGIRITGFANQGTARLYSTDSSYNYDAANPYFGYLTYDGTRWLFQVSPGTPAAVRVAYADSAGSASSASNSTQWDGYSLPTWTNWSSRGSVAIVVGQLAWKNYGNNHVIFDASQSTTPAGGGTNNTNPDVAWSATYPTLMGFNGSATYGVRVDSARRADNLEGFGAASFYRNLGFGSGYPSWDLNTVDPDRSGFTYSNGAPYTGPFIHIGASGYGMQFNANYGNGELLAYRVRNGDNGTWSAWRRLIFEGGGFNFSSLTVNSNIVLHAGNYTSYTLPIGGGWYGSGLPGSRWNGMSVSGGEIVFGNGLPNAGQMGILIDGCYVAGENNGFWSLASDNTWASRRGMFWNGSQLDFTTNSPNSIFADISIVGSSHKYLHINPGNGYEAMVRYIGGSGSSWYVGKRTSSQLVGTSDFHFYSEAVNQTVAGIDTGANIYSSGSMRSPIFYDQNNTGYYVDGDSTSRLNYVVPNRIKLVNNVNYEPRWDFTAYVVEAQHWYGNNSSMTMYIGEGNPVDVRGYLFNSSGNFRIADILAVDTDIRTQIFYDSNNTGYYSDPDARTSLNTLTVNGGTNYFYGITYFETNNSGYSGSTDSAKLQAYSSSNNSAFMSFHKGGHYAVNFGLDADNVMRIGGWSAAANRWQLDMSGNNWVAGSFRAPIFYDSDNTAYYLNPNGGSYFAGSVEVANGYFLTNGIGGSMYMTSVSGSFGGYLRTSGHMVLDQMNTGYNVYVLDGNSVGVVKNASSQSWSAFSDRTIKTVHSVMVDNLSKLESITPIYYSFNNFADDKNRIGLIAQEVQEQFPELVELEPRTEKLTLDYTGLIPVLLGAIKELKNKVEDLESRL